jgi:serine/threonine-protein kinase
VKLLDFGVAKLVESADRPAVATELTRESGRAFTPEFAAPEQGLGEPVTTSSDVYSLGVLLYLLLSGEIRRPPGPRRPRAGNPSPSRHRSRRFRGDRPDVAAARSTTPVRLSRELGGDLENIVSKALKIAPEERYPTAAAFRCGSAALPELRARDGAP